MFLALSDRAYNSLRASLLTVLRVVYAIVRLSSFGHS